MFSNFMFQIKIIIDLLCKNTHTHKDPHKRTHRESDDYSISAFCINATIKRHCLPIATCRVNVGLREVYILSARGTRVMKDTSKLAKYCCPNHKFDLRRISSRFWILDRLLINKDVLPVVPENVRL